MNALQNAVKRGSGWFRRLPDRLFEPVDIASIVVFRVMFGILLCWEVWVFFDRDFIRLQYIVRTFYFKYYGFEWVTPWPGEWMYVHFVAVALFALCVAAGFLYRVTSVLLFLGVTYWFLLDETRYLNHMYMVSLLAFLMILIPAHRAGSFDAALRPGLRTATIPTWCLWLLRFQVGIVYFYGGVAKINVDWLRGEPIALWLARRSDYPLFGPFLQTGFATVLFAYGGLLFDLFVVPLLFWKRSRPWAFAAAVLFHISNNRMFHIGIFPFLMVAATLLFFPPDWPRKFVLPVARRSVPAPVLPKRRLRGSILTFLAVYVAIQLLVPLRHFFYPGSVHWTEEGHRFAWHMMLRDKRAAAAFFATDPTSGKTWEIDIRKYLSPAQRERVGRWPDMCLQFAHFMAATLKDQGHEQIEIRVRAMVSLNGRDPQLLIDPEVDLSKEPRNLAHADWIVPLVDRLTLAADDQADAIVDKAIKALGGEAKLKGFAAFHWRATGKVSFQGNESDNKIDLIARGLYQTRQVFEWELDGNKFRVVTVLNGNRGWREVGGTMMDLDNDDLARARRALYLEVIPVMLLPLKGKGFRVESAGEEKVGDRSAVAIRVTGPDKKDFKLYFDKETGLPVKQSADVAGSMGEEVFLETMFGAYKDFGGIKKATQITVRRNGETFMEVKITEFALLRDVDPEVFYPKP